MVPPSSGCVWIKEGEFWEMPGWPERIITAKDRYEPRQSADPLAEPEKVVAALRDIPNKDVVWDEWKRIMLAT
jgi:hypothetical protein